MTRSSRPGIGLSLAPTCLAISLATLAASPLAAMRQDFEWKGRLHSGQTVEVKGIIGDIRAVPTRGDQVEVTADLREGRRGYPEDIVFDVVEHADGVTICAIYPNRQHHPSNECNPGDNDHYGNDDNETEVNFTVLVPNDVRFVGRTVTGDIDVRELTRDVEAYTVTGDIDVSTAGHARGQTVTGSIRARLGRADWTGSLQFKTVTGGIMVDLPEDTGADVLAKTVTGGITTDFPLTVRGRFMSQSVRGTIGRGGRELYLETVTGSIRLARHD
jgi:hypothetical protein